MQDAIAILVTEETARKWAEAPLRTEQIGGAS